MLSAKLRKNMLTLCGGHTINVNIVIFIGRISAFYLACFFIYCKFVFPFEENIEMKKLILFITICVATAVFNACRTDNAESGRCEILRVDTIICKSTTDSVVNILSPYLSVLSIESGRNITVDEYKNSRAVAVFEPDVQKYLPELDSVETILYQVGEKCAMKGIHLAGTKYVGVINPFFQPIITVDSVVYIGLNHYLGENYEGYKSFPEYVRHQKDISRMPYDVISSSLSYRYPFNTEGKVLAINKMLYEGALLYVLSEVFEDSSVFDILGYDLEQANWVEENEGRMWNEIVLNEFLFSSDDLVINKLCEPSPAGLIINENCPAMPGRYIGYKIVKSYLNNNVDVEMRDLLQPQFYTDENVLLKSKYSPK